MAATIEEVLEELGAPDVTAVCVGRVVAQGAANWATARDNAARLAGQYRALYEGKETGVDEPLAEVLRRAGAKEHRSSDEIRRELGAASFEAIALAHVYQAVSTNERTAIANSRSTRGRREASCGEKRVDLCAREFEELLRVGARELGPT